MRERPVGVQTFNVPICLMQTKSPARRLGSLQTAYGRTLYFLPLPLLMLSMPTSGSYVPLSPSLPPSVCIEQHRGSCVIDCSIFRVPSKGFTLSPKLPVLSRNGIFRACPIPPKLPAPDIYNRAVSGRTGLRGLAIFFMAQGLIRCAITNPI